MFIQPIYGHLRDGLFADFATLLFVPQVVRSFPFVWHPIGSLRGITSCRSHIDEFDQKCSNVPQNSMVSHGSMVCPTIFHGPHWDCTRQTVIPRHRIRVPEIRGAHGTWAGEDSGEVWCTKMYKVNSRIKTSEPPCVMLWIVMVYQCISYHNIYSCRVLGDESHPVS